MKRVNGKEGASDGKEDNGVGHRFFFFRPIDLITSISGGFFHVAQVPGDGGLGVQLERTDDSGVRPAARPSAAQASLIDSLPYPEQIVVSLHQVGDCWLCVPRSPAKPEERVALPALQFLRELFDLLPCDLSCLFRLSCCR